MKNKSQKKLATLTAVQPQHRYGVIKISNNRVISFNNNNPKQDIWINGGFFILTPKIFDYIKNYSIFSNSFAYKEYWVTLKQKI